MDDVDEVERCLYVSYCGIGPYGQDGPSQYFGGVIVDCLAPKTSVDLYDLEDWLRDVELPRRGRPLYSQLVLINWHELDRR